MPAGWLRACRPLVCSNASPPASAFAGCDVSAGIGHLVEDLYALARCDYLVGPPSTYTAWASFYGQVPLCHLETAEQQLSGRGTGATWRVGQHARLLPQRQRRQCRKRPDGRLEGQLPGHLVDIMATCVDVAGAEYPREFQGKPIQPMEGVSLRPALAGQPLDREQPLFFEHEGNRGIRDGDWKLVALGPGEPWELYNLKADRTEQRDLAAQHPDKGRQLLDQWEAWARRANAIPWIWEPPYGEPAPPGQEPETPKKPKKKRKQKA